MKIVRLTFALLTLAAAASLGAAQPGYQEHFVKEFPLDIGGSFWIDNPFGNVEIIGAEGPGMVVSVTKVVTAVDAAALKEGREQTQVLMGGDSKVRVIRTAIPELRDARWRSMVSYSVRVPRTVHVKIATNSAERIRVVNIGGNVSVKNVSGAIVLENVTGAAIVDTANGNITFESSVKPEASAQLTTVNGKITVHVPPDSNLQWIASTIQGDFLTNLPVRGRFDGSTFRGALNSPGGPTFSTGTMTGRAFLLRNGTGEGQGRSVRTQRPESVRQGPQSQASSTTVLPPVKQIPIVPGNYNYSVLIGSLSVGEIRGSARIETGAGEVQIGAVMGDLNVTSLGGPLDLGEIYGTLVARTGAGDIVVGAARDGGLISTDGGLVRVVYTGAPTIIHSGGGDIVVRQAASGLDADTHSGDITINVDPNLKTASIKARTTEGNIGINVSPRFAGDIDATVITSDPDATVIHTDFKLSIKREQIGGGRTRVHATGKVNGGGERLELYAAEGDIHISAQSMNPITLMAPQQ